MSDNNVFMLRVSADKMTAYLQIKPWEDDFEMSADAIKSFLKENGVKSGYDEEQISMLAEKTPIYEEYEVAHGKPAEPGVDGYFIEHVAMQDSVSKAVENADGTVDYFNTKKIAMVEEGDLLVTYVPATKGVFGFNVLSEMVPPVPGKDLKPLRGKGFELNEEKTEYRAKFPGRIIKSDEEMTIESCYFVKGDLGIEEGNINFNGDVEIKGDVHSGLCIIATGSITIGGHVGACYIEAGKDIHIRRGIQGRNKCEISAKGDVNCAFIERCQINAGGDVHAESVLGATVIARGKVFVDNKKGIVVDGIVQGMQGVIIKESGNDTGVMTLLASGVQQEYYRKLMELINKIKKTTEDIEMLDKYLKAYSSLEGDKRTEETIAVQKRIMQAKIVKNTELKNDTAERDTLKDEIEEAELNAHISVSGIVHLGTKITIGSDTYVLKSMTRNVTYKRRNHQIITVDG